MSKIHPSAVIHPSAQLAPDVEVGPGAVISEGAIVGAGSIIQAHAVLDGDVILGERNTVGYGCVIGAPPQDFAFKAGTPSRVRIGNGNRLREYVTIHRGTKEGTETTVGDNCFLMVGVHLGHNCAIGNDVIITNSCLLAGYVTVHDSAVLGGGSVFHQFLRIGRRAMVAGQSAFNKDIPPFVTANFRNLVVGLNTIGLRRGGFTPETRMEIKRAFRLVFRSGLPVREALAAASRDTWGPEASEFFDFIAASKRGICTSNRLDAATEGTEE